MKNIEKIIGTFFLIGLLNFLIFIQYLKSTKFSGGEVGMVPFVVLIASGISLVISTIIVLIIKTKLNINFANSLLIYHVIYFVTIVYWGIDWNEILNFNYQNIDLFIILIALFIWGIFWMSTKFYRKIAQKKY